MSRNGAVPEAGAPRARFEHGRRMKRTGADERRVMGADREAPASQKRSYAVGASEVSEVGGTTEDAVSVRVSAGREVGGSVDSRGPRGSCLAEMDALAMRARTTLRPRPRHRPRSSSHSCGPGSLRTGRNPLRGWGGQARGTLGFLIRVHLRDPRQSRTEQRQRRAGFMSGGQGVASRRQCASHGGRQSCGSTRVRRTPFESKKRSTNQD